MAASASTGALPTTRTSRRTSLKDLTVLLYGPSKVGKSTFCAQAEKPLFLATEPGLNALEVFQVPVRSWEHLLATSAAIEAGGHPFRTIILDTLDNAYKLAADYVRRKLGIDHESDAAFGKGFGLVNDELQRVLTKLAFLPHGLILVSHSEDREIETRTGKLTKAVPTLPEKARRIATSLVDIILFADMEETRSADGEITVERILRTKPSPRYEAGDRTGLLPGVLPLDFHAFRNALEGADSTLKEKK